MTNALSRPAKATAEKSAQAPAATSVADSTYMPAASAGTPTVHAAKTIACRLRSRIVCGDAGGVRQRLAAYAQYHVAIGSSHVSIPTTIWARNPTSPNTPYAPVARSIAGDEGRASTIRPMPTAATSDAPAPAA